MIDMQFESDKTNAFIQLFEEKIEALSEKIQFAESTLHKVNYEIERFYVEEDLYAGKQELILTTVEEAVLFQRKIDRYEVIIGLLTEKYNLIKGRLQEGITDKLERVNTKLELMNLSVEIRAKNEFINHYKSRKNGTTGNNG